MAKEYVYLQGKAKWARLVTPDTKYGYWGVNLYLTDDSLNKFNELKKEKNGVGGIRTQLKKDDDGYYISVRRPVQKMYKGKSVGFAPPEVLDGNNRDAQGHPLPLRNALVGNGSDITTKVEVYPFNVPGTDRRERAIRLEAVLVDNLVPFETTRDFDPEQMEQITGITEQPAQTPDW